MQKQTFLVMPPGPGPVPQNAHFIVHYPDGLEILRLASGPQGLQLTVTGSAPLTLQTGPGDEGCVLIERDGPALSVLSAASGLRFVIDPALLRADWPQPTGAGLDWHAFPPARAPLVEAGPQGVPQVTRLVLAGLGALPVPPQVPRGAVLALLAGGLRDGRAILDRLAALPPGEGLPDPSPVERLYQDCLVPDLVTPPVPEAASAKAVAVLTAAALAEIGGTIAPEPAPTAAPASLPTPGETRRPGLDIVVALYNQRAYVADCVQSLLAGAGPQTRVLVVDDGSTDGSAEIVAALAGQEPRLQLLRKVNGGCASARNYGRLCSDATHIAFVDADDRVEPGFHDRLCTVALSQGAPVVLGGFDTFDSTTAEGDALAERRRYAPDDRLLDGARPLPDAGPEAVWSLPARALLAVQPSIWRAVYARDFLDANGLWFAESILAFDDFLFHLTLALRPVDCLFLPAPRYLYRQHPNQDVRVTDARHFGNIAMAAHLLRDPQARQSPHWPEALTAIARTLSWSSEKLHVSYLGDFFGAAAEVLQAMRAVAADPGAVAPARDSFWYADFPFHAARAEAATDGAPVPDWPEIEPALAHPRTMAMIRAQVRLAIGP